jgi:hypothetical protein
MAQHFSRASVTDYQHLIDAAKEVAAEILRGSVSPYDGGKRIWQEQQLKLQSGDHRLDPFVYWASEYEETTDPERIQLCTHALRVGAGGGQAQREAGKRFKHGDIRGFRRFASACAALGAGP